MIDGFFEIEIFITLFLLLLGTGGYVRNYNEQTIKYVAKYGRKK
jgi:hypothetical protein